MAAGALLLELGAQDCTGLLELAHPRGEVSHVWLREGCVYAISVPGYRPALGTRLMSSLIITPEQLSAAVAEQRSRLSGHRIGEILVHLGFVVAEVIDAFVLEQVRDQLADLLDLPVADAAFHQGRRISQDTIPPMPVVTLLADAQERRARGAMALAEVGGPTVVPALGAQGRGTTQTPLGPHDWALLCRVDGRRDLRELARVCGFTMLETAQTVGTLAGAGLLVLPTPPAAEPDDVVPDVVSLRPGDGSGREWQFEGPAVGEPEPVVVDPPPDVQADPAAPSVAFAPDPEPAPAPLARPWDWAAEPAQGMQPTPPEPAAPPTPPEPAAPPAHPHRVTPSHAAAPMQAEPPAEPEGGAADLASLQAELSALVMSTAAGGPAEAAPDAPVPSPRSSTQPKPWSPPASIVAPIEDYSETRMFMRELSSLSDDPDRDDQSGVTRRVIPLGAEPKQRRKRFWER